MSTILFSDFKANCLPPSALVREAMEIINQRHLKIALVINENHHLLGTITDGDIRRGLLNGSTLGSSVEEIMNRNYRFLRSNDNQKSIVDTMRREMIQQIPVLDENNRVMHLLLQEELVKTRQLSNAVVIMAGGKGTRLMPHTEHRPKPMLPVGNQPMLEILLEQCIASGFYHFYLSVNHLKEQIIEYFGDGSRLGISIKYLVEDKPLGTAGALQLLPDAIKEPFLVINGDVLTRLNLSQLLYFHNEHQANATLCVREHEMTVPFGVVQTNGLELAGFEEKPTYSHLVNAGVYVIDPPLRSLLSSHQSMDMPTLLQDAQKTGYRVVVCPIHEFWIDVGRPETLREARAAWNNLKQNN